MLGKCGVLGHGLGAVLSLKSLLEEVCPEHANLGISKSCGRAFAFISSPGLRTARSNGEEREKFTGCQLSHSSKG